MISFERVSVRVHGKYILQDMTFSVAEREKLVLCGESGSGKSTVLKTIVGGYIPAEGAVYINGEALTEKTVQQVRRRISYIGQEPLLGADTVRDSLLLPFSFKAHSSRCPTEEQIAAVLDRLRLHPDILQQQSASISGGEKQRIAIARAILLGKKTLLADEIASALDSESKKAVYDLLLAPEFTVIAVSHDPEWIALSDRALRIKDGRLAGEEK